MALQENGVGPAAPSNVPLAEPIISTFALSITVKLLGSGKLLVIFAVGQLKVSMWFRDVVVRQRAVISAWNESSTPGSEPDMRSVCVPLADVMSQSLWMIVLALARAWLAAGASNAAVVAIVTRARARVARGRLEDVEADVVVGSQEAAHVPDLNPAAHPGRGARLSERREFLDVDGRHVRHIGLNEEARHRQN